MFDNILSAFFEILPASFDTSHPAFRMASAANFVFQPCAETSPSTVLAACVTGAVVLLRFGAASVAANADVLGKSAEDNIAADKTPPITAFFLFFFNLLPPILLYIYAKNTGIF
ncbi:hypothetical protein EMIT019CA3_220034 [Bacillus pseudomycoides]